VLDSDNDKMAALRRLEEAGILMRNTPPSRFEEPILEYYSAVIDRDLLQAYVDAAAEASRQNPRLSPSDSQLYLGAI